eukprot:TRINITY_DN9285_c0_g1_i1.p1 TRINITY_DN9285_c0_g1~~TRINITY_DN9285_c0_g1_i1.p1  ORF type:complete len:265 (-),score=33.10 TRINITY_DN9285_c0_g1_i1:38-832(-)
MNTRRVSSLNTSTGYYTGSKWFTGLFQQKVILPFDVTTLKTHNKAERKLSLNTQKLNKTHLNISSHHCFSTNEHSATANLKLHSRRAKNFTPQIVELSVYSDASQRPKTGCDIYIAPRHVRINSSESKHSSIAEALRKKLLAGKYATALRFRQPTLPLLPFESAGMNWTQNFGNAEKKVLSSAMSIMKMVVKKHLGKTRMQLRRQGSVNTKSCAESSGQVFETAKHEVSSPLKMAKYCKEPEVASRNKVVYQKLNGKLLSYTNK